MPRDLLAEKTLQSMPTLEKAEDLSPAPMSLFRKPTLLEDRFKKLADLRPYSLLLNRDDADDCDWLEHAAFDANEAASREKIEYRLRTCGELCTGIFTSAYATCSGSVSSLVKARKFPSVDSMASDRKRILIGHIIATKSKSPIVTDDSMAFPSDWRTKYQLGPSTGHDEEGETVCLHSLCVHPDFHQRGLGGVLLRGWSQRIRDSGMAKRIALICRERLVGWYEKNGFKKVGPSKCQYGGGDWVDMVMDFESAGEYEDC
ncbi:acetyltransferase [Massarina eburnea CBS 473.64]|uniref:Acetyltransferase n=1 Tax=Massarina eburnea CBS 473.64 TaxID=1395130 RepID=A0A6A6RQ42_9PLEO|nr:acetyltransferase [Massarina eburnea CBS 473.64]